MTKSKRALFNSGTQNSEIYWILFSFKIASIFASPKDFLIQPQDCVEPLCKLVVITSVSFPHLHLHSQTAFLFCLFPVSFITVKKPNVCPVKSFIFFLPCICPALTLSHPQDLVWQFRK